MNKRGYLSIAGVVLFVALLFSFVSKSNQDDDSGYIILDIYEVPTYDKKGIHIHYDDHTEVIPFKEFKKEYHDENGELLVKILNDLRDEGYEITSTSTGKAQSGVISKIIMEKK